MASVFTLVLVLRQLSENRSNNFCFNFLLVVFRLVNISSHLGGLSQLSEELQKQFSSPSLTEEGLVKLMDQFLQYVNMNSNCGSSVNHLFS